MSFYSQINAHYKVEAVLSLKKKALPKKVVTQELSFIKSEIKEKGFASIAYYKGEPEDSEHELYFIVPLKSADELVKWDTGKFSKDLPHGEYFKEVKGDQVYLDENLKLAWSFCGYDYT